MNRRGLANLLVAARSSGRVQVTLAGRSMRLWLARAEPALSAFGDPVAVTWQAGTVGLVGTVRTATDARGAWEQEGSTTALCGVPGRRYCHLNGLAELLGACGIGRQATLAFSPGQLLLIGRRPPARDGRWVLRRLRADGRLGVGPLRAFGPVPVRLELHVGEGFAELAVVSPVGVAASDSTVVTVSGPPAAPYVILSGPLGRRARAELGATGSGASVWVRAELGRLCLMPAAPAGALRRPR